MARIDWVIRGFTALVVSLSLGGCLSAPTGLDCAEAPPGTAGCPPDSPDGPTDQGPPGAEAGPADSSPADAGRDGPPPDAWPEDAAQTDARPTDARPTDAAHEAAHDGGADPVCVEDTCPTAPIEVACLDDLAVTIGDPICSPTACDDDPDCDPAVAECRGFVGCLLWCLLAEGRDDCEEACVGADPSDELMARFGALSACLEGSECTDGPLGVECQAAACGAEIEDCVGDIGRVWFVRPPSAAAAAGCDYPFETRDDCGARDLRCRRGECIDADGPCQPDPCVPRPELRCDGAEIVRNPPPTCAVEGAEAVCTYDEARTPCEAPPIRCDRNLLVESENPRCVDDEQGVYCAYDEVETPCDADRPAYCDGNTAVTQDVGRCAVVGGAADCVPGEQRRTACDADSLCQGGVCTVSACAVTCEARNIRGCDRLQQPIYVPCGRDRICRGGACQDIPAVHGSACRTAENVAACELSGLTTCRGVAAVPLCLFGDEPRAVDETCWSAADCQPGLLCTRFGVCSPGTEGSACETRLDCQPDSACQRGGCR